MSCFRETTKTCGFPFGFVKPARRGFRNQERETNPSLASPKTTAGSNCSGLESPAPEDSDAGAGRDVWRRLGAWGLCGGAETQPHMLNEV